MLENLKELVSINSYKNGDEIIRYLKTRFALVAEEIKIIKNKENDDKSIIIGINTKLKDIEPIVLSGHIDTVAPDFEKYNTNPFELIEINGRAYGLGSIDMKSFVAVILDNIAKLKLFQIPIVVALTTDEETDLICVENIVETLKNLNIKPKFTIVGEPTQNRINSTANGCYEFEIEAFGKACHSSILREGINAISVVAKLITFIENEQNQFTTLTSNCGVVAGGDIVNRVPARCKLKFDIRSTSSTDVKKFLKLILNKIKQLEKEYRTQIKIKKLLEIPPLEMKNEILIKSIAEKLNLKIEKFMGGCEAGYYQSLGGDAIIFGVGDMALAHKPNEFVDIREYQNYSELLINLIGYFDLKS